MTRFAVIPASYVYLLRNGEVLLQMRQNTGYMDGCWTAGAAGHIEHGETALWAASRELEEELGVIASAADLRPSSVMQRTDGTNELSEQRVDWFFGCSRWEGEPTIREPLKCAELKWFALDALPPTVPNYERMALDWLRENETVGLLAYGFNAATTLSIQSVLHSAQEPKDRHTGGMSKRSPRRLDWRAVRMIGL